ncbi:MAG: guanylate kinase [Syntrophomonadaceae bacterium]|nr:guanylate kinase [Syntrophomonadaceae bacterium]
MGILFVISGPSGVGKGTIREALLARVGDIEDSISATTREPRSGEIPGKDYFFMSDLDFGKLVEQDMLLEWAEVYGKFYGTPREFVMKTLAEGRDVLLEIDVQGARQVKAKMPEGVYIFISPPSAEELEARLKDRGKDSLESIERRMKSFLDEMSYLPGYNYEVVNDELETAIHKVVSIVTAERCRIQNKD